MAVPKLAVVGYCTIKIDKNVDIPAQPRQRGQIRFYPYDEMDVGDSFLCPSDLKRNSAYGIAREGNKRALLLGKPHRFKTFTCDDGMRCFRVA